ncbi:MAG: DUF1501 domain-containing protein [Planctomycetaceae bacterium]|nr:DUF1501 domain-containing protein [Planctomycetaceae bacterium]
MRCHQFLSSPTRRDWLKTSAAGFGSVAMTALAGQSALNAAASGRSGNLPHFPQRAKRIIFLFMWGGPSHVDLFDPKPMLNHHAGQQLSGESVGSNAKQLGELLGTPFRFSQHGESGQQISELFPQLARHADKLCVVRSLHTEGSAHGEALLRLHTGQANLVRPSVGAWVSYGLGRENENLPAFITISPPRGHGGVQNYGNAFLPAQHQATAIGSAEIPIKDAKISNLSNDRLSTSIQKRQLEMIQSLNRRHLEREQSDSQIEGLIANYELAFKMQSTMPHVMDLASESRETLDLYGIDSDPTDNFGRQCLLARKFAESGVRYIQVSTDYTWDHHQKVKDGSIAESAKVDRPIAGLLEDLNRRGLLDETLVVWGSEFGRTPMVENGDGRNHHPRAFTIWMAGGGVKGGLSYGTTDDFGYAPTEHPVHMHDLHATMLYALGFDHERLTYRHAGRDFRLTDVHGNIVSDLFA